MIYVFGIIPVVVYGALAVLAAVSRQRRPIHLVHELPVYSAAHPMVHSRSPHLAHYIAPMEYRDKESVRSVAEKFGWVLVRETEMLLHFEVQSAVFKFTDDVHLEFDRLSGQVYMSSRSRIGKSDFGANRKRLEMLRRALLVDVAVLQEATNSVGNAGQEHDE